ncbi:hypothetical protein BDZ91DRAFT_469624 [Kalaharituber pfeilii]|nr:hypothetical protein BDZ91DRAFT_469624 [Kalaharituber pfeilii]
MADEEPRRYHTRARSKAADETTVTTAPVKLPAITTSSAAGSRTARKAGGAASIGLKNDGERRTPRATSIPVPTRATRSSRGGSTKTPGEEEKAYRGPCRRGGGGGAAKKKVTFNEDKENLLPASEREAELKKQEMMTSDSGPSSVSSQPQPQGSPLAVSPVRKASAVPGSPVKGPIRPIGALKSKDSDGVLIPPLQAAPRRLLPTGLNKNDDFTDELDCPLSPGLMSAKARRPANSAKLARPEPPVNVLASPPRRNPPQQIENRQQRQLPAVVLTFNQPALLMQSPPRRGMSGLGQVPALGTPAGKLALPPKVDLLRSPPKRPMKKMQVGMQVEIGGASMRTVEDEEVSEDELSSEKYNILSPTKGAFGRPEGGLGGCNLAMGSATTELRDTDAEGDIEMTDVEDDECPSSPCPAFKHQGFGLFTDDDDDGDENVCSGGRARSVTPLVTELEELGLGLEGSRKSLFPKEKGWDPSVPLEDSAQLGVRNIRDQENAMMGIEMNHAKVEMIPIDPMLLEEDAAGQQAGPVKIPVKFGDEEEQQQQAQPLQAVKTHRRRSGAMSVNAGILAGAVVYVDVHTAEGACSSSRFVEILQGLGAKTVKQWAWNPSAGSGAGKIGITHVVFKDGSPRTLQKVKESDGVVLCVGVGWVMECEREQRWIDEALYAVDLDYVPRGGQRRRKSMEPKALAQPPPRMTPAGSSAPRQFQVAVNGTPPAPVPSLQPAQLPLPSTPVPNRLGFYVTGAPDQSPQLMEKLMLARRKSLKFAPKVGSPLGKSCMWADYMN